MASTEALYGPENPSSKRRLSSRPSGKPGGVSGSHFLSSGEMLKSTIHGTTTEHVSKIHCPQSPFRAFQAFISYITYFSPNGQDQASALLKARHEVEKKNRMSLKAISTFELRDCIWCPHQCHSSGILNNLAYLLRFRSPARTTG